MEVFLGVVFGTIFGLAIVGPRFVRMRRVSIGRILHRELTEDGDTYSVRVKQESVWTPGASKRTWGPGIATYIRNDSPDGVVYTLEFGPEKGAVTHHTGPMPATYVKGTAAHAWWDRVKRRVRLLILGATLLRLGCVVVALVVSQILSRWLDFPTWVSFLVACAVFAICDFCLSKGMILVAERYDRRHSSPIQDEA